MPEHGCKDGAGSRDSNSRHFAWKAKALPAELCPHCIYGPGLSRVSGLPIHWGTVLGFRQSRSRTVSFTKSRPASRNRTCLIDEGGTASNHARRLLSPLSTIALTIEHLMLNGEEAGISPARTSPCGWFRSRGACVKTEGGHDPATLVNTTTLTLKDAPFDPRYGASLPLEGASLKIERSTRSVTRRAARDTVRLCNVAGRPTFRLVRA